MRNFGGLLSNEWLKLYKKRTFFLPFAILAAFAAANGIAVHFLAGAEVDSATSFVKSALDMGTAGQFVAVVALVSLAGVVSSEYRMGTIKFLLIRAHSRSKILASKYVVSLLYTVFLIVFTAAATMAVGLVLTGFGGIGDAWGGIALNMLYVLLYSIVYVTLMFMVGILTRSSGVTVGVAMFCLMMGELVAILLSKYGFAKYILFANVDFSQYGAGGEPLMQGMSLPFSSAVLAVYMALFLAVSFIIFRKRDVS